MVRSFTQATFDAPDEATAFGIVKKSQLNLKKKKEKTFSTLSKNALSKIKKKYKR